MQELALLAIIILSQAMQGGKHGGGGRKPPTYIGIFAKDPKEAHKVVRGVCKDSLLDVLKHFNPHSYLPEGE
jgi:hypothetical protein